VKFCLFCLLIHFFLLNPFLYSQKLTFEHFSTESGISVPAVHGIIQDHEGFIWFGTVHTIHRYDGVNFKSYNHDPVSNTSITKGFVNVLYEDKAFNIWAGTSTGLSKFNPVTGQFQQYIPDPLGPLFRNNMLSVLEDSRGTIWVGAAMGLYILDKSGDSLVPYVHKQNKDLLNSISYLSIVEDANGDLWFGTTVGLMKFDKNKELMIPVWMDPEAQKTLMNRLWNTGSHSIPYIHRDKEGILWAGSFGGTLIRMNPFTGEKIFYYLKNEKSSETFPIQSITDEDNNKLWIGTYAGLILFDKLTGKIIQHYKSDINDNESISDDYVNTVLKERSGTLFAGTHRGGLNKVNRTVFPFHQITKSGWANSRLSTNIVYPDLAVSRSGSLFVGTPEGVEEIKPDLVTSKLHSPFKEINMLVEDSKGNLWIGVKQIEGGGLYKKNINGELIPILDSDGKLFTREVHFLEETHNGRIFFSSEFYIYEIDLKTHTALLSTAITRRVFSIDEIDNKLFIGTMAGGLIIYDPDNKKILKHYLPDDKNPYSIADQTVTGALKDKKGRIWLATTLGLNLFDPETERFKMYDGRHGLSCLTILSFFYDEKSGDIWCGTTNNIARFNPETESFSNYDNTCGVIKSYQNVAGQSGRKIFFKGKFGITYFNPDSVKDNQFIPPVKITEIKIYDKSFSSSSNLDLKHDQNYISFEFAALSFINTERNQYAYKMDGVDQDWVYSGNRKYAAYTDLAPGTYSFNVKASNNDGLWNEKGTSLLIIINPPWWRTYWAFGMYFLLIILAGYAWRRYDLKRQNLKFQLQVEHEYASKLQEISDMKSRFFTNISHEFRTPITLILGPADKLLNDNLPAGAQKNLGLIKNNALRLLSLINQLLDISKLDDGKMKLKISYGNVVSFIKGIVMIFESFAENKDIRLAVKPEREEIKGYFDRDVLEKILINILSNAFKFTPPRGSIEAYVTECNEWITIKVRDSGVGIPESEIRKLFDRFYQVDSSHTREYGGTGIGLALTKELVELHNGKISVKSIPGELTEFTIELPVSRAAFETEQFVNKSSDFDQEQILNLKDLVKANLTDSLLQSPDADNIKDTGENSNTGKLIVLVVEDNPDVRNYIKDAIGEEFQIEEASNGEQGVRMAEIIIPDLIVGDIMMPRMDGFAMTKMLKNDQKTDHIPIILLTAKSDQESKYEGLEAGADDYLIKPFDIKELKLRIHNLIILRKKLQERYSSGYTLLPPAPEQKKYISPMNERFIQRVMEIVKKHIGEEDFTVEDFGAEVGMSRTQLHRKLRALTGKSASRYIRTIRLNAAREMILKQNGNISEVAYSVGFSSPMYFSTCFKEEFGFPPSELLKEQK
jgi:signal transduction histidine kinase/ligand-binding sensor domain-containing protein/DNA-binding response OmpR family regulator